MRKIAGGLSLALALMATPGAVEAGPPGVTLELVPSSTVVQPGDVLTVDVVVSGLGDFASPSLGTFDFDLSYDDAVFTFTGVTFGPFLGDPMMGEAITGDMMTGPGTVNVFEVSLLTPADLIALQPSSFVLLTATYQAAAPGSGTFDLAPNSLGDENGMQLAVDAVIPAVVSAGPPITTIDIPTLSQWGLILMVLMLLGAGVDRLRRARS